MRRDCNQVLRDLDVGTYYASVRGIYLRVLVASRVRSGAAVAAVGEYESPSRQKELLADPGPDQLESLVGVSRLT
jgi:hypothetical protein